MGTINYKTNKYVTLALNTSCLYEEEITEEEFSDTELFIYEETQEIINKYKFEYFDVQVKGGYYDGFYIDFDFKRDYIDCYKERQLMQKEITQLKKLLFELIDYELNVCCPGWVTTWLDCKNSKEAVNKAIKTIRKEAKEIEIWR